VSRPYKQKIDKFQACRLSAASQSLDVLRPGLRLEFDYQPINERALRALAAQWEPVPRPEEVDHWDWEEIARAYGGARGLVCRSVGGRYSRRTRGRDISRQGALLGLP